MFAALLVSFAMLGGCQPDYITQLPVICREQAHPPYRQSFPISSSSGEVSISARYGKTQKPLLFKESWGCESWWQRHGLTALISYCNAEIGVGIFRTTSTAPQRANLIVSGATPPIS